MPSIHAKAGMNFDFLPLSNLFITDYMPGANATYVKVYLYVLYMCVHNPTELNTENVATSLHLLESDVIQALKYWMNEELLVIDENEQGLNITFATPAKKVSTKEITSSNPTKKAVNDTNTQSLRIEKRPDYTPDELHVYSRAPEIKQMFLIAQQYLGKTLTPMDLNILYSLYDWLRLPTDVIETLLEYCVSNGHRSLRYIEKVAINWADQGIDSIEKAKQQMFVFNKQYRQIMKSFGISRREPSPKEIEFMKKWLEGYRFPLDIIIEACNRTILNISQPNFGYADSILASWSENKVRTFDDIKAQDNTYAKQKNGQSTTTVAARPTHYNHSQKKPVNSAKSFINFPQRDDWDFDELERLEREYQEKKLLEG